VKTSRPAGPRRGESASATARSGPYLDPRLVTELAGEPWEQSWQLTPSIHTPVRDPAARQQWWTLERMLEPYARDALVLSGDPVALDLHCGEGWIAQRLLQWGAGRVAAFDDRPDRLRRARLLRDHFAISAAELDLRLAGKAGRPAVEGRFDVVMLTGAADRLGADHGLLSVARATTRSICAIECDGTDADSVARAALAEGFASVERASQPLHAAPLYVLGHRELLIAKVAIGG
jgi:hypothetical protein